MDLHSSTCLYRGFALYNKIYESYEEIFSSCQSDIFNSRSFFSTNSSLLMVLYMYKQYGSVTMSSNISAVNCKPVIISLCECSYYCWASQWERCKPYFNKLFKASSEIITFSPHLFYPLLRFSIKEKSCSGIQISESG